MKPMGLLLQADATEKTTQSGAKQWRKNCHKLKKGQRQHIQKETAVPKTKLLSEREADEMAKER